MNLKEIEREKKRKRRSTGEGASQTHTHTEREGQRDERETESIINPGPYELKHRTCRILKSYSCKDTLVEIR